MTDRKPLYVYEWGSFPLSSGATWAFSGFWRDVAVAVFLPLALIGLLVWPGAPGLFGAPGQGDELGEVDLSNCFACGSRLAQPQRR